MDKPAMNAEEVARQLRQPEGADGVKMGLTMNKSNAVIYQMVLDFLKIQPGEKILEIGFGNGHFIPALFERQASFRYTGLDMSATMVEEASRVNEARIQDGSVVLRQGTTEDMPFADGAFTKVFAVNVLYFWDQPAVALQAIYRVLAAGGELVLAIRSKETMERLPFSAHGFTMYSADSAKALLETHGFTVSAVITGRETARASADGATTIELENICLRGVKI
jgi:ubiquinone/menaquinone biosynthesis C-methylase UbiE